MRYKVSLAIVEAAAYYKKQGKSLVDVLHSLFERHGYYLEELVSVTKKGVSGADAIKNLLEQVTSESVNRSCRHTSSITRRLFNFYSNIYRWTRRRSDSIATSECFKIFS